MENQSDDKSWFDQYADAVKQSLGRIWANKFLWMWGIFLISGSCNLNINMDESESEEAVQFFVDRWGSPLGFWQEYQIFIILGIILVLSLQIGWWVMSVIARKGVILSLDKLQNTEAKNSQEQDKLSVWRQGKTDFWEIVKIDIIIFLVVFVVLTVLWGPVVYMAILGNYLGAFSVGFLALMITLPLIILERYVKNTAVIQQVLANRSAMRSIEGGYKLCRFNLTEAAKLLLVWIIMGIVHAVMGIIVAIAAMAVGAVFLVAGLAGSWESFSLENFSWADNPLMIVLLIVFGVIFFVITLFVNSIFALWFQDVWVWWVKKVGGIEIKQEQEEKIKKADSILLKHKEALGELKSKT